MNGKKQNPATQTSSIFATLLGGQVEHSRRMNLSKSTYPFILRKRVFNRVRRIFSLFFYSVFRLVYLVKEKTSLMQVSLSEKTTVIIRSTTTSYLLLVTCFELQIWPRKHAKPKQGRLFFAHNLKLFRYCERGCKKYRTGYLKMIKSITM